MDDGEEAIEDYVEFLDQYNDQDDNNAELSKKSAAFLVRAMRCITTMMLEM